jgi:hypothetical protein
MRRATSSSSAIPRSATHSFSTSGVLVTAMLRARDMLVTSGNAVMGASAALIAALPNLRAICSNGVGFAPHFRQKRRFVLRLPQPKGGKSVFDLLYQLRWLGGKIDMLVTSGNAVMGASAALIAALPNLRAICSNGAPGQPQYRYCRSRRRYCRSP